MRLKNILVAVLLGAGCSGYDGTEDTTTVPQHVDLIRHSWHADGTEDTVTEDVVLNLPPAELDEPEPFIEETGDYGQTAQATVVSTNYGSYSGGGGAADTRCPSSWSSPNYCSIPATKNQNIMSILAADHGLNNTRVQTQADVAFAYFGNAYIEGNPREFRTSSSGGATVLIRPMQSGDCGLTDLACTISYTLSSQQFNIGGKPYRKHLLIANPHGDVVYSTMYVSSTALVNYATANAPSGLTSAQRQIAVDNFLKNSILHEWGHAIGHGHNPSSQLMKTGGSPFFYAVDAQYTTAETGQRINFVP